MLLQQFPRSSKIFIPIIIACLLTACDGGLNIKGNIFLSDGVVKCDSCRVFLFDPNGKIIGSVYSSYGEFSIGETVPPFTAEYMLVLSKKGFINDTLKIKGPNLNIKITDTLKNEFVR